MCICPCELDSFPTHTGAFDEINGDVSKCEYLILDSEVCQPLEDLHNLGSEKFPSDECILQKNAWVKNLFKGQGGPMDFNETDCESSLV